MIKHHGQGNLQNKEFVWVPGSRELGSMMVEWEHGRRRSDWELTSWTTSRNQREWTGNDVWFLKTPKPSPGDILSPGSPDVPRLPKQRSPSGNQVLKSSRLWKTQRIQTSTKWELCSGHHHGSGLMWADLIEDVRDFCVFGLVLVGRGREWHRQWIVNSKEGSELNWL